MRWIVTFGILLGCASTLAQGDGGIASPWRIGPVAIDSDERSAKIGTVLWRQPLNAAALVTLERDAVAADADGNTLLSAGDELFQIVINNIPIYCDSTPPKPSALSKAMFGGGKLADNSAICLIDGDRDGKFDHYVSKKIQFEGVPIVRNPFEYSPKPLQKLGFNLRPAGPGVGGYWVGVRYASGDKAHEFLGFQLVFGDHRSSSKLTENIAGAKGDFPRTLEVLGAKVVIFSVLNGVIRYRIDQVMPDQPFSIVRSVRFR
jgi:hypothetical protein